MPDREKLKSLVAELGLMMIGDPLDDPEVDDGKIIFVRSGKLEPSLVPGVLTRLKKRTIAEGMHVKIVEPNPGGTTIESFLKAAIRTQLPDVNVGLVVAAGSSQVVVWIDFPANIQNDAKSNISDLIGLALKNLGFEDPILKSRSEINYPSTTTCLRVLRRHAPCSLERLTELLRLPGFDAMPSLEVRRFLDTSRRKGQVVRRGDGKYILSLQCLMDLGSARNRFSPDVARALALRKLGA
jgi:hypothetical protein